MGIHHHHGPTIKTSTTATNTTMPVTPLAASAQGGTTCHDAFLGSQGDNQMRLGPLDRS
jgi:hypothetical protein